MVLLLSFVAVFLACLGAALLWQQRGNRRHMLQARLDDLRSSRAREAEADPGLIRAARDAGKAAGALQRALQHRAFRGLPRLLHDGRSGMQPGRFLLTNALLGAALGCAAGLLVPLPAVRAVAFAAGAALPTLWLRHRRNRRLRLFCGALPDATDLMGRALRAGHSLQQTLEMVADESAGPLGEEFQQLHRELQFGVPLREALRALAARVPSPDLHFLVTAIAVQKESGGDLPAILDRAAHTVRDRMRVEREVQTYTAQGRLTGWILSALPVVLLGLSAVLTPSYSSILFHDRTGQLMLTAAAGLIVTGTLLIRRVVRVEV